MIERDTGRAARQARRKVRRKEAKHHGAAIPDPDQTTRMVIPDHIQALGQSGPAKEVSEDEQ